jgi:hypothetical protein
MTAGARRLLMPERSGWRMAGQGGFRRLPNGIVESYGGSGLWWYADEAFDDFLLSVEWRIAKEDDNSGVFLRCPPLGDGIGPAIERGYEIQIDDRGFDPQRRALGSFLHMSGAVYRLAPARRRCSRPLGEWNLFEITARGPAIMGKLNGEEVSLLENAARERRGHVALQAHHEGSACQFRELLVEPL